MGNDKPMEFSWPGVGTLKVTPLGEKRATLRFFPSTDAIEKAIILPPRSPQEGRKCGEGKGEGEGE